MAILIKRGFLQGIIEVVKLAIKDLKPDSSATLEQVEVIEKGEVRTFEKWGKSGRVCNAKIKDDTGETQLTLWNEQVDLVNVGDKLKLEDVWVKEWRGELQVSIGKRGKLEKL